MFTSAAAYNPNPNPDHDPTNPDFDFDSTGNRFRQIEAAEQARVDDLLERHMTRIFDLHTARRQPCVNASEAVTGKGGRGGGGRGRGQKWYKRPWIVAKRFLRNAFR